MTAVGADLDAVDRAAARLGDAADRLVLAVSGGLDSMVLLDAAARALPTGRLLVATFDHGTGAAARAAVRLVRDAARTRGLDVFAGGGTPLPASEAAWRDARWAFLRRAAADTRGAVVTAHTADDQAETVLMRALRGAGARGLAALHAGADVRRPFLELNRATLGDYAVRRRVAWVEDPSNRDPRFLRNRVRHEILPALERVRPAMRRELLAIGERAAAWRAEVDELVARECPVRQGGGGELVVAASLLRGYDEGALAVLWPAVAAQAGVALDRRGTRRLAEFTRESRPGSVMPLSGTWEVVRGDDVLTLRRARPAGSEACALPLAGALRWGRWCFYVDAPEVGTPGIDAAAAPDDRWIVELVRDRPLAVRGWRPADRLAAGRGRVRVKRLLAEAGIATAEQPGWPVVVEGEAIVWIPGVSRGRAATARSGRPGVRIRCEPRDG